MEITPFEYSGHTLDSDEVDSNARMTAVAFCNFLQNLAGKAAEKRGFGITFMRQSGFVWVLAKVKVKIRTYPVFNDEIKLETWVRGVNRIISDRHFTGYNKDGNKFADAITEWVLLDIKSRRPQIIEKYIDKAKFINVKSAEVEMPEKIRIPGNSFIAGERKVVYSDIDLNKHVSNIKYLEWFLDTYDYDFLHKNTIEEFELNFLNECRFGQIMTIYRSNDRDIHYGSIKRKGDDKEVFRVKIKWG